MKNIFLLLFSISTFISISQENNYSTVYFIGYGGPRKLYLNDQLITSFGDWDIIKYKVYSKGRISVTFLTTTMRHEGAIEIKDNKMYYYIGCNRESIGDKKIDNEEVEENVYEFFAEKIEKTKNVKYKVIELEEDKTRPIGKLVESENDGPKQGTCFLVSKQGYLLTNYHVISGAKTVQIKGIGNDFSTLYGVDVVAYDVDLDLALLKLKNQNITFNDLPYDISQVSNSQGTKSFVLGYPMTNSMGEEIKVTEGIINAKSGYKGSISQYQFSAAVQSGNSGSPLFNENGDVIGIINAKLMGAEGAGYAIKSQYISTFLKLIDSVQIESNKTLTNNLSLADKTTRLKDFIFIVKTE